MLTKMNLLPQLRCTLDSCYDPTGGYVESDNPNDPPGTLIKKPWGKDHQPGGEISLSAALYECYVMLCQKMRVERGQVQEQGGGGVMIQVKDLVAAFAKVAPDTEVMVEVQASE